MSQKETTPFSFSLRSPSKQSFVFILLPKSHNNKNRHLQLKGTMKKHQYLASSSHSLGSFPSPGFDNTNKGWCSERLPHPSSATSRRRISGLTPFYSGRAVPSKWEDAERWICSPVSAYGVACSSDDNNNNNNDNNNHSHSNQAQFQKRPKSKSGPIGAAPGVVHYSNCSPALQVLDSVSVRNFVVNSPFSTGVLMPNGVGLHYGASSGGGRNHHGSGGVDVSRSISVPVWSDLVSDSSLPSSPGDERVEDMIDEENAVTRVISRRDMATQMSPDNVSSHSSPARSSLAVMSSECSQHLPKMEIREVQVDKKVTMTSCSMKCSSSMIKTILPRSEDFHQNAIVDTNSSSWEIAEAVSDFSRIQREEAKITAWENLQKAKAEAAMRKLEVKLEKKRSSSMDKIMLKLRMAQTKAQKMRSSMSSGQEHQISKRSQKQISTYKHMRLSSFRSCFTCHVF
ncbi:Remorin 4.1 [Linum perenne]